MFRIVDYSVDSGMRYFIARFEYVSYRSHWNLQLWFWLGFN